MPGQTQPVSILVVSTMTAVRWLEANAGTIEQEKTITTLKQLRNVKFISNLDLFKVLRLAKTNERIRARQRLMPWLHAVMTSWMYEPTKRHMSRNTEAYEYFQLLNKGPGAYKGSLLTHRNAVNIAGKRVAEMPCTTENEKKGVL